MLEDIIKGVEELDIYDKERYQKITHKIQTHKNAFFMSYIRYSSKLDDFEKELENDFNNDLKAYLHHLKTIYPSL